MKRRDFCGALLLWPTRGWGHAGHPHSALQASVLQLQRDGADFVIRLALENRSKARIVVNEAYAFGSVIRRQSFPLPVPAETKLEAEVVMRFYGAAPESIPLMLLHTPGGQTDVSIKLTGL